jgi:hypothetical protein
MSRYDKAALVAILEARIVEERAETKKKVVAWEKEFVAWQRAAPARLKAQIALVVAYAKRYPGKPPLLIARDRNTSGWYFDPPNHPARYNNSCSIVEQHLARLRLLRETKNGAISLSDKDPILSYIPCR